MKCWNAMRVLAFIPSPSGSFKLYILAGLQRPLAQHPGKSRWRFYVREVARFEGHNPGLVDNQPIIAVYAAIVDIFAQLIDCPPCAYRATPTGTCFISRSR